MVDVPLVSVCVPAHGDAQPLRRLADHLGRQTLPRAQWELVVAVDGPDPALEQVARAVADRVVVLPANAGSYAARNAAMDAAHPQVRYLAFTDTDCLPAPTWLAGHLTALDGGVALSGGAVRFLLSDRPSPAEFVDSTRFLQQEQLVTQAGFAATCNLAGQAAVLRALRFDERLRSGGDRELGLRAARTGHPTVYTADALVEHPARTSAAALLRKTGRTARGQQRLRTLDLAARPAASTPRPTPRAWAAAHDLHTTPGWRARSWLLGRTTSLVWLLGSQLPRLRGSRPSSGSSTGPKPSSTGPVSSSLTTT